MFDKPVDNRRTALYVQQVYWNQKAGCTSHSHGGGSCATYNWWEAQTWRAYQIGNGHWAEVYAQYEKRK